MPIDRLRRAARATSFALVIPLALSRAALAQNSVVRTQTGAASPYVHRPTIHGVTVVFSAGGDLWIGADSGGVANRLTSAPGLETDPRLSPDGTLVAFTGELDGSREVYVVPAKGGAPRRLTFDPYGASVLGWSPDGANVLVKSARENGEPKFRAILVPVARGAPRRLPLTSVRDAALQGDGRRLAYVPGAYERLWFGYRGGQAGDIWIVDLRTGHHRRITRHAAADVSPVWIGDTLFFLSERQGYSNLFRLNPLTGDVHASTTYRDFPLRSLSGDGQRLIFEHGTEAVIYDPRTAAARPLRFTLAGWEQPSPRDVSVLSGLTAMRLVPGNTQVLLESRGQILRVPFGPQGPFVAIASAPGTRAQHAAPSPDGRRVAYVSDALGAEEVWIRDIDAAMEGRQLTSLKAGPLTDLAWSPDGRWLVTGDHELRILLIDAMTGKSRIVDQGFYPETGSYSSVNTSYRWSPDGRWLTYAQLGANDRQAVFLYEVSSGSHVRVTAPDLNAFAPSFDPAGKYLYYLSEREYSPRRDFLTRFYSFGPRMRVSLVTLGRNVRSPLLPTDSVEAEGVAVDTAGIQARSVDLPLPTGDYSRLDAGAGQVLVLNGKELLRYSLASQRIDTVLTPAQAYELTPDGRHVLIPAGAGFALRSLSTGGPGTPEAILSLDSLHLRVDPRAEWRQIFEEAVRVIPKFFYDSTMHGLKWGAIAEKYRGELDALTDRADLNVLLGDLLSELSTSHARVEGGDLPASPSGPRMGHLGVDLGPVAGRNAFEILALLPGDGFDLRLRSPLLEPGLDITPGMYILSVNGEPVHAGEDFNRHLVGQANQMVTLRIGTDPSGRDAWNVSVRALADESLLRYARWAAIRRRLVDSLSKGRLGYVHVPTMGPEAMQAFAKRYYAQLDRDGVIIDVRNNGGGSAAETLLLQVAAKPDLFHQPRYGFAWTRQAWSIPGGRFAALCDEWSGSNAEEFCVLFRELRLGPVVGSRTEGGVIGSCCGHRLIDGGSISIPNYAAWVEGRGWVIEGHGVVPDVPVDQDPAAVLAGRDLQLERAVRVLLRSLAVQPRRSPAPPHRAAAIPRH